MCDLSFDIQAWLGAALEEPRERETLASLQITVGASGIPVTEVEDTVARTVRRHINVPASLVAGWLLANWWRLRWEPQRDPPSYDWLCSHSMAAIGGGYAWPGLTFSSDGELIQLRLQAETTTGVAAVRYLNNITFDLPAAHFEHAVDRFLDQVEPRFALRLPGDHELSDLRAELELERHQPAMSTDCKLQALAGVDPGAAPEDWLRAARALMARAGGTAAEELLAVAPEVEGGIFTVDAAISAMCCSTTTVRLDWAELTAGQGPAGERAWERGARLAAALRAQAGISAGPLQNKTLEALIEAKLPLPKSAWNGPRKLRGGFRNEAAQGRAALLVASPRNDAQRFYLARLIAAASQASADQQVLLVSDAATARQKLQRSFAQEFLCPWEDLRAFTDQYGTDDDGIADAATHFAVSERVVLSTLVNKGMLPRSRLLAA